METQFRKRSRRETQYRKSGIGKHITERVAEGNTLQKEWQREAHYRKRSRGKHITERVAEGNTLHKE